MGKKATEKASEAGDENEKSNGGEKSVKHKGEAAAATVKHKGEAAAATMSNGEAQVRLDAVRQKGPRKCFSSFLFLPVYLCGCAWIVLFYKPCKVKNRTDCGWSGISAITCRTTACLAKPGKQDKVTITVQRKSGAKSGLKIEAKKGEKYHVVKAVKGAVEEHNEKFPEQAIVLGDRITKVDGKSGGDMKSALNDAKKDSIAIEVLRPANGTLASYLPSIIRRSDHMVALAVQSPAFEQFGRMFAHIAGAGFFVWFLSGYPMASLPIYYFGSSAFVAWHLSACCYNDQTSKPGDPHCYANKAPSDIKEILKETWKQTTKKNLEKLAKW